ncbi:MAG: UDP-N-acetylmuramate--L-alanine ligase [Candidatus Eremiobacteraeota bacterium]|nr:UDP-N-acetylmuramate--L-alanine ligase [Candidatus Eremiobacteraeota bacterium]
MRQVHFIGIGGIGMSGIARVLLEKGYRVTGSDIRPSSMMRKLEDLGASCFIGHSGQNIGSADVVVVSSAIPEKNPELVEARRRQIKVVQRAEMLGFLMQSVYGIAVAGTHGKTTTTSMIAAVLEQNGLDPTVVIGGELNDIGSNARLGHDPYLVAEADESDASFLHLSPRMAVITSIDSDVNLNVMPYVACNYDYDLTMKKIIENFKAFIERLPGDGNVVLCIDNENVRNLYPSVGRRKISYGLSPDADIRAEEITLAEFCSTSKISFKGKLLGNLHLRVPGRHNVQNALAAIAIGLELGFSFEGIRKALHAFPGVQRRFQILGEASGVLVVDDYAHNPSKIKAALHAARTGWGKRVIAVFQPHRYSRTRFLFDEFSGAFNDADVLIVTDIYSAGEQPIVGMRGETLAEYIAQRAPHVEVLSIPKNDEVIAYLAQFAAPGDLVITLGAGDICRVAEKLCERLNMRHIQYAATG